MKIVILNFSQPIERRLMEWLRDYQMEPLSKHLEKTSELITFLKEAPPDLLLIDADHTQPLIKSIKALREKFPSLILIGLTDTYVPFIREKLLNYGLSNYLNINEIIEKEPDLYNVNPN